MKTQKRKIRTYSTAFALTEELQHNSTQIKNILDLIGILLTRLDNSDKDIKMVLQTVNYLTTLTEFGEELVSKLDEDILKLWQCVSVTQ